MKKIICDKCKSGNVEEYVDLPKVEEKSVSMTEYADNGGYRGPQMTLTVMVYYKHILTCKDCGHRVEFMA